MQLHSGAGVERNVEVYNRAMTAKTAADVESICSKCGDVWHVVVAKVGDRIAKVQCKQCGAYHRYRPPGGKEATGPRKRSAKPTGRSATASAPSRQAEVPEIEPDMNRPVREYSVFQSYEPADRIEHVKFGLGVVEQAGDGKMQVFFPSGRRVLAQGRPERKLSRPAPFEHDTDNGEEPTEGLAEPGEGPA